MCWLNNISSTKFLSADTIADSILDALEVDSNSNPAPCQEEMDLATFLISRACHNSTLANYFCWYVLGILNLSEASGVCMENNGNFQTVYCCGLVSVK